MASPPGASPHVSGDELRRQTYVDYIRSCYKNDLEAFSYYEALVDYIEKGSRKYQGQTQHQPKIFELRPIDSAIQYPALFPFTPLDWSSSSKRPQIVMLEGFPSPDAVVQLARRWNLRPELFIGHIFGNPSNPHGFYSDPTLPSRQGNVVRVHFSSLVKSLVQGPSLKLSMENRSAVEEACRTYEKRLFAEGQFGVTRFREINQHDTCCSIEQAVSFTVVPNKGSWVAIYLTDEGTSFLEGVRLPWTSYHNYTTSLQGGTAVGTVPIVPYNKPVATESCDWNIGISENNCHERRNHSFPSAPTFSQLHPSRNIVVNDEADMELLSEDPFFLLASLLTTSALSFMQLLNYLSVSINEDHSMEVDLLNIKLERLRNCVRIVQRVEAALAENLQWIAQGGCSTWRRARPGMSAAIKKQALQSKLRTDHEALQRKCIAMRQDCESAMAFLVSYSQLLSGERGIAQAGEVARLTKLAAFFVPLAFVTSAFGMNIKELGGNKTPSFYVFAVVAVITLVATYVTMFWTTTWGWLGMLSTKAFQKLRRAK